MVARAQMTGFCRARANVVIVVVVLTGLSWWTFHTNFRLGNPAIRVDKFKHPTEGRRSLLTERSDSHSLFDGSLQFLSGIVSRTKKQMNLSEHSSTTHAHPISFLSLEEVHKQKSPISSTKSIGTPTARQSLSGIAFLSEEETKRHKQPARTKKAPNFGIEFSDHESSVKPSTHGADAHGVDSSLRELHSPSVGTIITPENILAVLKCPNQSKCIVPGLQLQKKVKVYFCKHLTRHGVRFYYLAREGLLLHPNVELVDQTNVASADHIVYLPGSTPWHLTECNNTAYARKIIVLDEFDGPTPLFVPAKNLDQYVERYGSKDARWFNVYFKRSFVRRNNGVFVSFPHLQHRDVFPLTYSIAEAYVPHHFNFQREIEILCTLRGHSKMPTRQRVQQWVAEYGKERNISNTVTTASRTTVSVKYFQQMYNSKIIVTVNPSSWEGDFRLWESLSSGALVFVDPLFVPHPFPLVHAEHVIYFSNTDKDDLFKKLDYYRGHPDEAQRIAHNGFIHAMKHHRTVSMIDYVLRTAHLKEAFLELTNASSPEEVSLPKYTYSGQYLNKETRLQEQMIKKCLQPGVFSSGELGDSDADSRLKC